MFHWVGGKKKRNGKEEIPFNLRDTRLLSIADQNTFVWVLESFYSLQK